MKNRPAIDRAAKKTGFTLLEVMIAAGVLGIGCFGVLSMLLTAQDNNSLSGARSEAIIIAERYQAALENEARAASINTTTKAIELSSTNRNILSMVVGAAHERRWELLGRVNALAVDQANAGATMAASEPNRYCVGIFNRASRNGGQLYTGAIRVYWRKDNRAVTDADCGDAAMFPLFDTYANRTVRDYNFVTVPYSVMPGTNARQEFVLGR